MLYAKPARQAGMSEWKKILSEYYLKIIMSVLILK